MIATMTDTAKPTGIDSANAQPRPSERVPIMMTNHMAIPVTTPSIAGRRNLKQEWRPHWRHVNVLDQTSRSVLVGALQCGHLFMVRVA